MNKKNAVKEMDISEVFSAAIEDAHTSGDFHELQIGDYGAEIRLPFISRYTLDRYDALEAIRAAQRFDFSTVREALEEWLSDQYQDEREQSVADAIDLVGTYLEKHPEIRLTDCDEGDEQEIIDDEARDMTVFYPDYSDLFSRHFPNVDIDGNGDDYDDYGD